jgi:hypothetical protein
MLIAKALTLTHVTWTLDTSPFAPEGAITACHLAEHSDADCTDAANLDAILWQNLLLKNLF